MASYKLSASAEVFEKGITALSKPAQTEGPQDILRNSFNVNGETGTAGSIIIYRDPEAWMSQHAFVASLVFNRYPSISLNPKPPKTSGR